MTIGCSMLLLIWMLAQLKDVDWDKLIENRSVDLCQKRWKQMVKHIGSYWSKSFPEQVEILSERYCPDMLEAREIYANKPRVL
ncbi:hypothetical protein EUGRSUZ_H02511 [Eucalyptus grandis]|uniref:Uncharacterized protein n=2 Tax=Eucalyptus grandis TaxID=71139 RepID=A0ACC3JR67_EUCGR|nr:hypothetical protein EUGRSUZ_H02511 [Eucalyptus grandis]